MRAFILKQYIKKFDLRKLSIYRRLRLSIFIIAFFIFIQLYFTIYFTNKIAETNGLSGDMLTAQLNFALAKRYEKNFFIQDINSQTFNKSGISKNVQFALYHLDLCRKTLKTVETKVKSSDSVNVSVAAMEKRIADFIAHFNSLILKIKTKGNWEFGLEGELMVKMQEIKACAQRDIENPTILERINSLSNLAGKYFIERTQDDYKVFLSEINGIIKDSLVTGDVLNTLVIYKTDFKKVFELDQAIGKLSADDMYFRDIQKVEKYFKVKIPDFDIRKTMKINMINTLTYNGLIIQDRMQKFNTTIDEIVQSRVRYYIILIVLINIMLLSISFVVIYINFTLILKPLSRLKSYVTELVTGKIPEKVKFKFSDEITDMAIAINTFLDGVKLKTKFANAIGSGDLNAHYTPISSDDILGLSLLEMQSNLLKANNEENIRRMEDEKRNWTTNGLAKFSDILRKYSDSVEELATDIIRNLVEYLEANVGGIFIVKKAENKVDISLELVAAFAYERMRFVKKEVDIDEGLVGRCATEKKTIWLTDLPDNYMVITSGLGDSAPRNLLLVPLVLEGNIFGVIEIAAFKIMEKYEIEFAEQLCQNIATTLRNVSTSAATNELLKRSQLQADEMHAKEEILQQNFEEMRSAQEELLRKEMELSGQLDAINRTVLFVEYNLEGQILQANESFCDLLGYTDSFVIGRLDGIFYPEDEDEDARKEMWSNLQLGIYYTGEFRKLHRDGNIIFLKGTYYPVSDKFGKTYKVLFLGYDISESKELEEMVIARTNEIHSKEHELKVHLSELKETQMEIAKLLDNLQGDSHVMSVSDKVLRKALKKMQNMEERFRKEITDKDDELNRLRDYVRKLVKS